MPTSCLNRALSRPRTDQTSNTNNCTASQSNDCMDSPSLPKWLIQDRPGGWRRVIQNFTPSWFAVNMGTGIVSILLQCFSKLYPQYHSALLTLSIIFFVLNIFLFSLFLFVSILRYVLYPGTWNVMLHHPVQSLFLGTLPMGFSTIVNMFALVCVPKWGGVSVQICWGMWWVDAVISVACCLGLPFMMMTKHKNRHETMTAAWLLPIVAPIVAASSGAVVASVLSNPQHAQQTIITSYVLWGTGVPLALVVMVIYFHRLAIFNLPPHEVIVSVFLPLGPMGQGGYGIMELGSMAMKIFPVTETLHPAAGEILFVMGFGAAIIMWGFGLVWLFFALGSILDRKKFPFNMGWWGFTFPVGVFSMSTMALGEEISSAFFKILGTVFGICAILLWFVVAFGTAKNVLFGNMFDAPCLRAMEKASREVAEKERQEA